MKKSIIYVFVIFSCLVIVVYIYISNFIKKYNILENQLDETINKKSSDASAIELGLRFWNSFNDLQVFWKFTRIRREIHLKKTQIGLKIGFNSLCPHWK